MPRFEQTFVLICFLSGFVCVSGMDCSFGSSSNFVEKALQSCPGILDSSDKSYCCWNLLNQDYHCCNKEDFFSKNSINVILPIVIGVLAIAGLIGCCACCLYCSCCPWYRRRHAGTVYGTIQTPIVQVTETRTNLPRYPASQPAQNVPFPTQSAGVTPPPYVVTEEYAKQAPYNPAYAAQQ